ncbi:MAG TPA: hypothetical protein VMT28_11640 [Terriglobales bacterium]|jgi:hypothetical protein|nr:hypothetical protein [Terriglobales bacterium]
MSLSFRLLVMATPLAVWGMLYLACRLRGIPLPRLVPWLKGGFVALMGTSLVLFVFDRTHLSDAVAVNAWGLFGAQVWIERRYKMLETRGELTSLNLAERKSDAAH